MYFESKFKNAKLTLKTSRDNLDDLAHSDAF